MVLISTMTILELSTAVGIILAGIAGLLRSSKCRKIECGILKGIVCERDIEEEDIIATPKNDFDRALKSKPIDIPNAKKGQKGQNKETENKV